MKKAISLAFLMMSLIIVFHIDVSRAIPWKANATYKGCDATIEDCLIPNHWEEAEFSLNSHVGRMLFDVSQTVSGNYAKNGQPAIDCQHNRNYRSCLPSPNGGGPRQRCGDYTRSNC